MTDLKPCPFCGSPAEIMGTKRDGYYACCTGLDCGVDIGYQCGCDYDDTGDFKTPEEAAAAWNKRAI